MHNMYLHEKYICIYMNYIKSCFSLHKDHVLLQIVRDILEAMNIILRSSSSCAKAYGYGSKTSEKMIALLETKLQIGFDRKLSNLVPVL